MSLCNSCRNFDLQSFANDPDGLRGYQLRATQYQAKGCRFCALLIDGLKEAINNKADNKDLWIHMKLYNSFGQNDLGFNRLRAHVGPRWQSFHESSTYGEPKDAIQFFVAADPESAAARNKDVYGRYLGEDPKSYEQISALQEWLDDCLGLDDHSGHSRCKQTMSGTTKISARKTSLPTRCIDVGSETPKLVETKHKTGSYIILSHRWNDETELCRTTTLNYATRTKTLPLDHLPKTFQDVVWITQRLGVRYLWIDSICIIQEGDEGEDWKKEAVKMAKYYQHSLMTIAATAGSTEQGLFPPFYRRTPRNIVELPYRSSTGSHQGSFYVYESANIDVEGAYFRTVSQSELLKRGWVFQEFLLSRRIVCYTRLGVFYQCDTDLPRNDNFDKMNSDPETTGQFWMLKKFFDFQSTESLNDIWYKLVETYTRRKLKYPDKDRIVALAGIAKEFKEALAQSDCNKQYSNEIPLLEYVSGLWLRDIHYGLLWEMELESIGKEARMKELPTWSWASQLAGVEWSDRAASIQKACEVVGLINKNRVSFNIANIEDRTKRATEFDVDNMFTSLLIRCQMQPVYIGQRFGSEEDIEEAKIVTGHKFRDKYWRAVCSPSTPTIINGWASIEEPALDMQLQLPLYEGTVVQAMHVSTIQEVPGGVKLGYFGTTHHVFNVLFVQYIGDGRFERVGVGKLYGKEISRGFREAVRQEIELV